MLTNPTTIQPGHVVLELDLHAIVLPQGEVLLGRGAECLLRIDDPSVSRVHLKLVVGDTLEVEDLGSTNGTLVNGAPLRSRLEPQGGRRDRGGGACLPRQDRRPRGRVRLRRQDTSHPPSGPDLSGSRGGGEPRPAAALPHLRARALQRRRLPRCGAAWPKGRPGAPTDRHNPALARVRRHHRYAVQINVRYESDLIQLSGTASNLSYSGVFVSASRTDAVGTICRVTFLAQDEQRTFEGFVRHVIRRGVKGRAGMGIEFCALDAAAIAWITERLESWWRQDDRA